MMFQTEYAIRCDMSALQKIMYKHFQEKGVILTDADTVCSPLNRGGFRDRQSCFVTVFRQCPGKRLFFYRLFL